MLDQRRDIINGTAIDVVTAGATRSTWAWLSSSRRLPLLELTDGDATPLMGRANHRRVHQLEHGPLAEGMRHDLGPRLISI